MELDSVPIPSPSRGGGFYKYPWDHMKISESFLVPDKTIGSMSSVANRASKRTGFKFTCRTTDEGVRVWRIA